MCNNFKETKRKQVIGYKVVGKRNGKYYSVFTGKPYPTDGRNIPKWKTQKPLTGLFNKYILDERDYGWEDEMVGRTAVFLKLEIAEDLLKECLHCRYGERPQYEIIIVKVELKEDLIAARYQDGNVICGRNMTVVSEVN